MFKWLFFLMFPACLLFPLASFSKTVRYELTATKDTMNLSGKKDVDFAIQINGSIPAPTLVFTEGDDAEITVKNPIPDEELSIHWHGILLPPDMDGVPYVTTPPINSGESHIFRFRIRQYGTYWYHSHTSVQEQKGVYGALVFHPKKQTIEYDKEVVAVLSDWSDEKPERILKNLRKDGDYYQYKKNTVRSYFGAIQAGGFKNHLMNEWSHMGGMDLSDVGYDAFLINGKRDSQLLEAHPGEKIRLRIINASASSYFYVSLGQEPMKVISADGVDIEPVLANEILIGTAETYDVLFEIPQHKNYELRATVQDVTGYASGWLGMGEEVHVPDRPKPDLYAAMAHDGDHAAHNKDMNHQGQNHQMSHEGHENHRIPPKSSESRPVVKTLTVDHIKSKAKTDFPHKGKVHDLKLVLGGDMERYVWHINGKTIAQDRNIIINEGDIVRFTFVNETMMHHPFHLHGHFFRVLTSQADYSPLKHTVDVEPMGTRTIEFLADEPGEWMLHCHNLYHLKTGMARVVKYASFTPSPEILSYQKDDPHMHDPIYFKGMLEAATNHAQTDLHFMRSWDTLEAHFETRDYDNFDESEGDLFYRRWFSRFFNIIAGGTRFEEFAENKTRGVLGVGYILPMLVETNLLIDHKGKLRLDLEKRFQWTKYIFSDMEFVFREQAKTEFEITLMYAQNRAWSAGLMFTEDTAGVGLQYQF